MEFTVEDRYWPLPTLTTWRSCTQPRRKSTDWQQHIACSFI